MKKHYFLAAMAATAMAFTGCSNDDVVTSGEQTPDSTISYLALSIGSPISRANTQDLGSQEESTVTTADVLLFDSSNKFVKKVSLGALTQGYGQNGYSNIATSDAFEVPTNVSRAFVVANPTLMITGLYLNTGVTFDQINVLYKLDDLEQATRPHNFLMTNAGVYNTTSTADEALVDITNKIKTASTIAQAKALALADPAVVYVNRVVAKVQVNQDASMTTVPTNANISIKGYGLTYTNGAYFPYSKMVKYNNNSQTVTEGIYRRDGNWTATELTDYINDITTHTLSPRLWNVITKVDSINRPIGSAAYCFENTMEATEQLRDRTTSAVIQVQYTPDGFTTGQPYLTYQSKIYSWAAICAAVAAGTIPTSVSNEFTNATGIPLSTFITETDLNTNFPNAAQKSSSCQIKLYQNGMNYYLVPIRHDSNVTTPMALGRWGVVRNNWYKVNITKITVPADPWIPVITDPDDSDKEYSYMAVEIIVNPWTVWNQDVEL